jgi:hypothetical protein
MKNSVVAVVIIVALAAGVVGLASFAHEPELPSYKFVVTITDEGLHLQCKEGCAWKELTFSCGGTRPCSAVVDQFGVRGPDADE